MSGWNSEQYLKFKKQRTLPAVDLVNRIKDHSAKSVVDIGCGPGNSTTVLKKAFPSAVVMGIDSSQNMIDKAKTDHPDLDFKLCDAYGLEDSYDVIFSNACLQWIPEHEKLIPFLMDKLNDGGVLAVQVPMNGEEPLFKVINEVVGEVKWGLQEVSAPPNEMLPPDNYYDILSKCSNDFQIWETVYYHSMPSHASLVEWVKGTRLLPYLSHLDEEKGAEFQSEILKRASEIYPVMSNGEIIFRFRRFFFTAVK